MAIEKSRVSALRTARGQALMELAVGMFALALVVSALCGFSLYIVKSLRAQNSLRSGTGRSSVTDKVEFDAFAAEHVFGAKTLKIREKVEMPPTGR